MERSSGVARAVWRSGLVLLAALGAAEPSKPPWQRLLQGDDAKKAAEQEKQLEQLQEAGKFADAFKVAEALAELRAKAQGADHWEAVNARWEIEAIRRVLRQDRKVREAYASHFVLKRQASALRDNGRYREAQPLLEELLAIHRQALGEEHPHTASGYNNLALNLYDLDKYGEAEKYDSKALAIFRKMLGENHPDTITCYHNLANDRNAQGKYKEADEDLRKALAGHRKVLGEEHRLTAASYSNLAGNLADQDQYQEAEKFDRKALAIRRKIRGEQHPDTATSLYNLAIDLNGQGRYIEAEPLYLQALAIRLQVLSAQHPDTALTLVRLAVNLNDQGKYAAAELLYRQGLAAHRQVLGEQNSYTATSLNRLAGNLTRQGRYVEAESLYRRSLEIYRKVLGEKHPWTAASLNNLAWNLQQQGKYDEAEPLHRQALDLTREIEGEQNPHAATALINLAVTRQHQKIFTDAERLIHQALAIHRLVLGEQNPKTINALSHLASILDQQGKHAEAEPLHRQVLALHHKVLDEEHPHTASSYNNVASNLHAQGKYHEAETFFLRAADSFAKARLHVAASGLERATITSERSPLPRLAAVLARNGKLVDAWQRFEESLARGTWDDLSARLRRPLAERTKQDELIARLARLDQLIARTFSAKEPTPEQIRQRETLLMQQRQTLEELAAFARHLEDAYGPAAGKVFARETIQAALPPDAALIGWLDIPSQPNAADPNGEHWSILLRAAGSPVWVRLSGSGEQHAWTDADSRLPSQLRAALQTAGSDWQPLADRLRQQRVDPLAPHLKGVRRLYVLPSTAMAGVPAEVLADGYTVSYAHSGTMHAHLRQQPAPNGKGLFALADPVFDTPAVKDKPQPLPPGGVLLTMVLHRSNAHEAGLQSNDVLLRYGDKELSGPADFKPRPESSDHKQRVPVIVWREGKVLPRPLSLRPGQLGASIATEPAPQALAEQRRWDRWLASRGGDGDHWDRLPGTRFEVASLRRMFAAHEPVELLLDSAASEQQLSERAKSGALGRYRYLHLATHGQVDDVFPLRSAVILSRDQLPDANKRLRLLLDGQPIPDGRLTAEEVLRQWELHCELVTLSACQTALGKYERGEGFVGFAQALILSGSRSVCLSLWNVKDTATALFMERFYQNLLGKREGLKAPMLKAAALAEAKEWLRKLPRAEALKRAAFLSGGVERGPRKQLPELEVPPSNPTTPDADRPYAHPHYWAAFVLIGDPD
jgi:tetratricopeptide (TPR) repeat protein